MKIALFITERQLLPVPLRPHSPTLCCAITVGICCVFFSLSLQAAFNEIKDNFKQLTPRCCCQHNAACYPALPPLSLSLRCSTIGHGAWRITLSAALIKSISSPPSRVLHATGPSALCLHHPVEHTTGKKNFNFSLNSQLKRNSSPANSLQRVHVALFGWQRQWQWQKATFWHPGACLSSVAASN